MTIVVDDLTKRYGAKVAVAHLSFTVNPGVVTGFLGPNGSGKSTSMRCMLGLDRPQTGTTTFHGKRVQELDRPLHEVGALLDASYVHPGRSGRNHLRWLAASNGIAKKRVDEVLDMVGLTAAADKRLGEYSLGMKQRLGLATVLLGDPHSIILDEPANGLDPEGIRWIREVLVHQARQGKNVLVSSHLLSEMALMADALVVIGKGQLVEQCTVDELVAKYGERYVRVASPQIANLTEALRSAGHRVDYLDDTTVAVHGTDAVTVGEIAAAHAATLHELSTHTASLEDAFIKATEAVQEYKGSAS